MFDIHIIGNISVPTSKKYECCAFNMFSIKLAEDLSPFYNVHLYGTTDDNNVKDNNLYTFHQLVSMDEFNKINTSFNSGEWLSFNNDDNIIRLLNLTTENLIQRLRCFVNRGDIILSLWILYESFYRVFNDENYFHVVPMFYFSGSRNNIQEWRHGILCSPHIYHHFHCRQIDQRKLDPTDKMFLGYDNKDYILTKNLAVAKRKHYYWKSGIDTQFDNDFEILTHERYKMRDNTVIIPPYYDNEEFPLTEYPNNHNKRFLYLGRIQESKGVHIIFQMAKLFPQHTFLIAGDGVLIDGKLKITEFKENPGVYFVDLTDYPNVQYLGFVGGDNKKELLRSVDCLIQPSRYLEPFGLNVLEAAFCGLPSITPSDGGFYMTNSHTGLFYGPHNLSEDETILCIQEKIRLIEKQTVESWNLFRNFVRNYAVDNFSKHIIIPKIVSYLETFVDKKVDNFIN